MDITNRTVFIAGATSGIGLELARRFLSARNDERLVRWTTDKFY